MISFLQDDGRLPPQARLFPRIALGALQGLALWALAQFKLNETAPMLFGAVILCLCFVPTLLIGGLGQMRLRSLLIWAAIAAAILAALGAYDAWREMGWAYRSEGPQTPRMEVTPLLWVTAPVALYIAHHLIAAADRDRKPIANYETYFDISWTSAVQIALASAFTLALWLILWLGAALFHLIGLKLLGELLLKGWFIAPLLGGAFGAAVHVSDVRQGLARGMRTLALTLLGWLAPVLAGLTALFLIALPFTGLTGLWSTKAAGAILLTAAIILTALTNAAYQDGGEDKAKGKLFQASSILTALALPALVALAAYALGARIGQYGLTPERIFAAACVTVAGVYAIGYLATLVPHWRPYRPLEKTNILGAGAILAAFLALFSPLADPARLAAADQSARLIAGKIKPDKFDFQFLARDSGRFGRAQLDKLAALKDGPNATDIARVALALKANKYENAPAIAAQNNLAERITVYPKGAALPDWLKQSPNSGDPCLGDQNARCNIYMIDVTGDGVAEAIFEQTGYFYSGEFSATNLIGAMLTLTQRDGEKETRSGQIGPLCTVAQREALKAGVFKPMPKQGSDLEVAGQRMEVAFYSEARNCPK